MKLSRRKFVEGSGALILLPSLPSLSNADASDGANPGIATNTYPWLTFARREKREFKLHTDQLLAQIVETGITGYEPIIEDVAEFSGLAERLRRHRLQMHSIYVNVLLHDENVAEKNVDTVVTIAKKAARLGTRIVVANPTPIRWGGREDKSNICEKRSTPRRCSYPL